MNTRRALAFIFCTVSLDVLALGHDTRPADDRAGLHGRRHGRRGRNVRRVRDGLGLDAVPVPPLLGALSDRYGRRPVILISCLGLGLDYIFMALAPSLLLLLVGRIVSGITSATISTSFIYIADVTKPEERARAFGLVGMAFGLGFVVGPAIGGLLEASIRACHFWVSAAACLANAAFGWFVPCQIVAAGKAHGLFLEAREQSAP